MLIRRKLTLAELGQTQSHLLRAQFLKIDKFIDILTHPLVYPVHMNPLNVFLPEA